MRSRCRFVYYAGILLAIALLTPSFFLSVAFAVTIIIVANAVHFPRATVVTAHGFRGQGRGRSGLGG